jgi:ribonuclease J
LQKNGVSRVKNGMVKNQTTLTFYGGVNEIGGNKILLQDRKTRIFLDFGQSFTFGSEFFTSWLQPRGIKGLGDYFEFNLLPKISGLYSKEMLASTDFPYTTPEVDCVFLSHAHFDHIEHIQFLDPNIPVCMGAGTKLLMESMEETGNFADYGEHTCNKFRTGHKIKTGNLTVEPIAVDHSIPAAYGFIIHTSEGPVVYTGDLRRHGPRKDLTENFIEKAKGVEPIALICEGTRMAEHETRQNYSEPQVKQISNRIVAQTDKVVFTIHASRDIDRFKSFFEVAKNNNRKLVITPKTAYLLTKLLDDEHISVPDPVKDDDIVVYYKKKKSGSYDEKDYFPWERKFMNKMINSGYVQKNQRKLIMDLDFYQFAELVDIKPEAGSHFIHSMSEPFSEEGIEDTVMHNWLDHFNLRFHQVHASGHMSKDQLVEMVKEIHPKQAFPVHTENAELFKKFMGNAGGQMSVVEKFKEYQL